MAAIAPFVRQLGAALLGFGLSILVIEILLHAIEASPAWRVLPVVEREPGWPDPENGYALRPNQSLINVREQRARVSTNAAGMRDAERSVAKPAGTYRVAVTGDSYTEALQVPDDATFTRRAEALLNAGEVPFSIEVLNFGMSGAGPVQQLVRARHSAAAFAPEALIMMINARQVFTDYLIDDAVRPAYVKQADGSYALGHAFRERRAQRYRDSAAGRLFFLLMDHSRLARAIYLRVLHPGAIAPVPRPGVAKAPVACANAGVRVEQLASPWRAPAGEQQAQVLDTWLRDTAGFAATHGMRVVLVLTGFGPPRPDCPQVGASRARVFEQIGAAVAGHGFRIVDGDREIAGIAARAGITSPLSGFGRALGVGHLNSGGHRAYARLLEHLVRDLVGAERLD